MLWRMLVVFACVAVGVSGDEQEAWKAIYDHWDLGSKVFRYELTETFSMGGIYCRHDACSCPSVVTTCNTAGNITVLNLNSLLIDPDPLLGAIPPQIGQLTQLTSLDLSGNKLSGIIPTEIGQLTQLTYFDLSGNELSGIIPPQIGQLTQLTHLQLNGNKLSGIIPTEIGKLTQSTLLDLSGNLFEYPPPQPVFAFCKNNAPLCSSWLPPQSCSAFRNRALSADFMTCVKCYSPTTTIILLVVFFICMVIGVRKLLQMTKLYPGSVGGTVASIGIVTSHAQMTNIITSMDLSWPVEAETAVQRVLPGFFLDFPGMVHAQCLFSSVNVIQILWTILPFLFLIVAFVPSCFKRCTKCCCKDWKEKGVDETYNGVGMMVSFVAIPFTKAMWSIQQADVGWVFVLIVAPIFCFWLYKFFREIRAMQGKWDGVLCRCRKKNCPVANGPCCFCCHPVKLPQERLERRLDYLTKRFVNNAAYWQFVVWARQISLLLIGLVLPEHRWLMALLTILICLISIYIHVRVQPFHHDFQNNVEKWLLIVNIFLVLVAVVYSEAVRPAISNDPKNPWVWVFSVFFLLVMFGSIVIAMVYLRLWKAMRTSFRAMWAEKIEVSAVKNRNSWLESPDNNESAVELSTRA